MRGECYITVYNGREYPTGIIADGWIVLRMNHIADIEKGFIEITSGRDRIYVKFAQKNEV